MLELVESGGWLMWPIIACSVIALAIISERFWSLQKSRVAPTNLIAQIWEWEKNRQLNDERIFDLKQNSPLGQILAVGLINRYRERSVMKESIEEIGQHVSHDLERFLNALGTIAAITPLLGLLGTVIGMIRVFSIITVYGVGDPSILAEGISEALITTAAGLSVAIPTLMFHRYFQGRVAALIITMEQEAIKMIEVIAKGK